MNRSLLIGTAIIAFVVTILGFVFKVPVLGWIFLVIGVLALIGSFMPATAAPQPMAASDLGRANDPIFPSQNQGVIDRATPLMGATNPVNAEVPVDAGPPHVPESREDPFDNNGTLGNG